MNEVFQVLMYLFERHMERNCDIVMNEEVLSHELEEAGFLPNAIDKALAWLNGLLEWQKAANSFPMVGEHSSMRIYTSWESMRLNKACRGFIIYLEQLGVLNPVTREMVIDRLMALDTDSVDLPSVKWVILMVLFNQTDKAAALACMERLVLGDELGSIH